VATLKSATPLVDGRSYTALKMGNVVVAGDVNLDSMGSPPRSRSMRST
jgi:hypothetical protein